MNLVYTNEQKQQSFQADVSSMLPFALAQAGDRVQESLDSASNVNIASDDNSTLIGSVTLGLLLGELGGLRSHLFQSVDLVAVGGWFASYRLLSNNDGSDYTINGTIASLASDIVNTMTATSTALGVEFDEIYRDYGKLQAVGTALDSSTSGYWYMADPTAGERKLVTSMTASYYEILMTSFYEEVDTDDANFAKSGDYPSIAGWGANGGPFPTTWKYYCDPNNLYICNTLSWTASVSNGTFTKPLPAGGTPATIANSYVNLRAIGVAPMFTGGASNPNPPLDDLWSDLADLGVDRATAFGQWPFPYRYTDVQANPHCWSRPGTASTTATPTPDDAGPRCPPRPDHHEHEGRRLMNSRTMQVTAPTNRRRPCSCSPR